MSRAESLERLIVKELTNVPTYLWGGFFPFHVAIWRFLNALMPENFGLVDAFKRSTFPQFPYSLRIMNDQYELTRHISSDNDVVDGYEFNGPSAATLDGILWGDGVILDVVEHLAYYVSENTDREKLLSGRVDNEDLPSLDRAMLQKLASALYDVCASQ